MPKAELDGLSLAYDIQGEGPPLLMINGIGAARAGWGLQVPAVSPHFRTITYDNRDVGETTWTTEPHNYPMRRFADDAAALLDHLVIESAHIVGASMGGAIAQEFAIGHPDKTKSVTIVCSWPKTDPWMFELMSQWDSIFETQGAVAWSRTTWLWVMTHRFFAQPGNLESMLRDAEAEPIPQSFEAYMRQSSAFKRHDALDRLPSIEAPAHVIVGEEDIYTPPRYSVDIANAIPGARLTVLPEVGHGAFWEATEEFNRVLIEFLLETERSGSSAG
jgi:3-oxoadipate enol-lactonase